MKYLILSDIHGNMEALQSALLEVNSIKIDKYIILGDLVGYGASPNEVVDRVRRMNPVAAVRGNHDKAAAGLSNAHDFNYAARDAALWTRVELSPENRDYVAHLPQGPVEVDGLFDIIHGAPWDEDYYIFQWWQAQAAFQRSDKRLIFFGHTHVPVIWTLNDRELRGEAVPDEHCEYPLEESRRYLINPGSVGQPRDGNPKASLAILDSDVMEMQFFRIEYNVEGAQAKIRQAGLDRFLVDRLAVGR
jgi:predicted phosphodiesterase